MATLYERPTSLEDALEILPRHSWTILAGGTDIYPAATEAFAWGRAAPDRILDVTAIDALRGIEETPDAWRIGSLVTWTQLLEAGLPDGFRCLLMAAREVGGRQIQNRATLVGNICNASPAADGVPALLALDAVVELRTASGTRVCPLADYILGNRKTARTAAELVTAIIVPKGKPSARSTFRKLGARRYLVVSIAMAAALFETDADGNISRACIAVGACSEVAQRLPELEAALFGQSVTARLEDLVTADMLAGMSPIDDVRASAEYRRQSARILVSRAIADLRMQGASPA